MGAEFLPEHPAIPGYVPLRLLGRNGAIIYLARRAGSDEQLVLKVACEKSFADDLHTHHAVFLHLDHPNILRVFEIGGVEGCAYVAIEYINGRTLADRLREGPLDVRLAVLITRTIALTLGYMRNQRMIHVNLTPPSILLTDGNEPKLIDLQFTNIVDRWDARKRATVTHPAFSAPEDLTGEDDASAATDFYRVGAIMYAMLTAQAPFVDDVPGIVAAVLEQPPAPPRQLNARVPKGVQEVCLRCLEKRPESRYASLPELADALGRL